MLRVAGASVAATSLAAGASAATSRHGFQFDRVVDAVDDLGCDPNGGSACQDKIRNGASDGTLIEFPSGTYLIDDDVYVNGASNFGIVGEGDVTFKLASGTDAYAFDTGYPGSSDLLFENVTIDQTASGTRATTRFGCTGGEIYVKDVDVVGPASETDNGNLATIMPFCRTGSATVTIENFVAKDGGEPGTYISGGAGSYVGSANVGTIRFVDSHFEGFPNNGVYASRTKGNIEIEGGVYKNNEISQIRICGEGSYVDGASIVVDHGDRNPNNVGNASSARTTRGVWWESGSMGKTGGEVRNTNFIGQQWDGDGLAGMLAVNGSGGAVTVRNCAFEINEQTRAVRAASPSRASSPHEIQVENTTVTGDASRRAAILIRDRPGSHVESCCIQQPASRRHGVRLVNSSNCKVVDSTVNVGGETFIFENSNAETSGISESGSCPAPDLSSDGSDYEGRSQAAPEEDEEETESQSEAEESEEQESEESETEQESEDSQEQQAEESEEESEEQQAEETEEESEEQESEESETEQESEEQESEEQAEESEESEEQQTEENASVDLDDIEVKSLSTDADEATFHVANHGGTDARVVYELAGDSTVSDDLVLPAKASEYFVVQLKEEASTMVSLYCEETLLARIAADLS